MAIEREQYCPVCGKEQTFYRAAATTLHLGKKVKWRCTECNYGIVEIEDAVEIGGTA